MFARTKSCASALTASVAVTAVLCAAAATLAPAASAASPAPAKGVFAHVQSPASRGILTVATTTASPLPSDLPAASVLRSSPKKVFAHYLASLPVSLDNQAPATDYYARNYLAPNGEGGIHAAYGGFLRNRPLGRGPLAGSDWRLRDMQAEVRQAAAAGLDGFSFDVLQLQNGSVPQLWANANLMLQAAAAVDPGFKIMLMPDMSGSIGRADAATLAAGMASLAQYPSAYRLADNRLVISPFKAEAHNPAWWSNFLGIMQNTYGIQVAFLPVFVANEQPYIATFAPISYGMSNWGSRNPQYNDPTTTGPGSPRGRAAAVKSLGMRWMQPVSLQDNRPNQGIFDESGNTENLRATWQIALSSDADMVQLPTWNDQTEGTAIQPSAESGWSFLDLQSYYLTWFKTGSPPPISRDTVYLTHRIQPAAALPSFPETRLMSSRGGTPTRDTVEALTFLTSPGNVLVTVGSKSYLCAVNAGVDSCLVPLGPGTISATVSHAMVASVAVTSARPVTTSPYVQDLSYIGSSSGRTPGTPSSVPFGAATRVQRALMATSSADGYVNAGAPDNNYGTSSSLSVRGSTAAISYLRFAPPTAPAGTTLTGASVRLRTIDGLAAPSADPKTLSLVADGWTESGLTWNSRPATGTAVASLPGGVVAATTYDLPISPDVVAAMVRGSSLALTSGGTDEARFWSGNYGNAAQRPQLMLTYTPDVPAAAR